MSAALKGCRNTKHHSPRTAYTDLIRARSELERQKTIAENQALLEELGLDPTGASKIPHTQTAARLAKPSASSRSKPKPKRKSEVQDEGPRRRSGRLAGLEATQEEVAKRNEEEEKEREVLRVINRKVRDQVMDLGSMVEDTSPESAESLVRLNVLPF